jgi:hypothetical protein
MGDLWNIFESGKHNLSDLGEGDLKWIVRIMKTCISKLVKYLVIELVSQSASQSGSQLGSQSGS